MDDAELEVDAGDIEEARELAEATDAALRTQPDPALYGWLCFYRFKACYLVEAWQDAWDVIPPRFVFVVTPTNAAWMFSVEAELAARLGDALAVVDSAERCIAIRRQHGNRRALFLAAQTACELLHRLGRDDLDVALVRNIVATDDPGSIDLLLDARELLSRCDDECAELALDFARTSPQVMARIAGRQTAKHRPIFAQR